MAMVFLLLLLLLWVETMDEASSEMEEAEELLEDEEDLESGMETVLLRVLEGLAWAGSTVWISLMILVSETMTGGGTGRDSLE